MVEAYSFMYAFLENRYKLTNSDELGSLLGSMALLPNGGTADPAIWSDWLEAINDVKAGKVNIQIDLK